MTSIVKIGGKSGATLEKNQRIIEQIRDFDDDVVVVVSANGGATDRIRDSLEGTKSMEPDEIFREFEEMHESIRTRHTKNGQLTALRKAIYSEFERIQTGSPRNTAALHMSGERLAATLFDAMLDENGIDSEFVDFTYEDFPLIVRGDSHNARIDFDASREAASGLKRHRFTVLPGYGGYDRKRKELKTLGRGGSDTSAMGNMYAFQAGSLWVLSDVPGILRYAGLKGSGEEQDVVSCLDINETKDAASLGAKLPGRKAVEGAEMCYKEGARPLIYVTMDADISGHKTRIVPHDEKRETVKLVAGRDIILYEIDGDIRGLQNVLIERGIEFSLMAVNDHASLMVPEFDRDSRTYIDGILGGLLGGRSDTRMECHTDYAWIGVVGNGMESQNGSGYRQAAMGVAARATAALQKFPIIYNMDPGKVSLGYMVPRKYSAAAQKALYNEFLNGS